MVADLDVAQLRAWPWFARVKPALDARLAAGGSVNPWEAVDLAAVAVWQGGTDASQAVVVARGRFLPSEAERTWIANLAAAPDPPLERSSYHGFSLVSQGDRALALVTARTVVFGARGDVRRVLDIAAGDEVGLRRAGDRTLLQALGRAPEAKLGRPALRLALRPTVPARMRAIATGVPSEIADRVDWVSLALALGDGFDLGLVVGVHDAAAAQNVLDRARLQLDLWRRATTVRLFQLGPLLDAVRMGRKPAEAHFAVRLDGRRFQLIWDRVGALFQVAQPPQPSRPNQRRKAAGKMVVLRHET